MGPVILSSVISLAFVLISAIVCLLGTLLAAFVGALVAVVTNVIQVKSSNLSSRKSLISQYITDKRIQWIQELRNETALFLSQVQYLCRIKNENDKDFYKLYGPESKKEMFRTGKKIQLLLNPKDNKEVICMIDSVMESVNQDQEEENSELSQEMNTLSSKISDILKQEWERAKREVNN